MRTRCSTTRVPATRPSSIERGLAGRATSALTEQTRADRQKFNLLLLAENIRKAARPLSANSRQSSRARQDVGKRGNFPRSSIVGLTAGERRQPPFTPLRSKHPDQP